MAGRKTTTKAAGAAKAAPKAKAPAAAPAAGEQSQTASGGEASHELDAPPAGTTGAGSQSPAGATSAADSSSTGETGASADQGGGGGDAPAEGIKPAADLAPAPVVEPEPEAASPDHILVAVRSRTGRPYRRAGRVWTVAETTPEGGVTFEVADRLLADPNLAVRFV